MENQPTLHWQGLISREQGEPWALLVGGEQWGRRSPSTFQQNRPSWQQHLAKPATLRLTGGAHQLRACRRAKSACATIERNADHISATLHVHGAGGMLRVNDAWITEEDGQSLEIVAGDVIELVCVQHPTVRQPSGWYTPNCHERDRSGANLVSLTWRFVPQRSCIPMLSPTEDAKRFFPPRLPLQEATLTGDDDVLLPSPTACADDVASPAPPSKRLKWSAVVLRMSSLPELRRASPSPPQLTPMPLPVHAEDFTWS